MNAVHVTVNGVLVGRNNSRLEDFIEAAEPVALIGKRGTGVTGARLQ